MKPSPLPPSLITILLFLSSITLSLSPSPQPNTHAPNPHPSDTSPPLPLHPPPPTSSPSPPSPTSPSPSSPSNPPCHKCGRPVSHPPSKRSNAADDGFHGDDGDYHDMDYDHDGGIVRHRKEHHHGPNKVVLGVAIALSSVVFLVVFLILCSKCCR